MAKAALTIPPDKVAVVQSEECAAWAVENCLHGVAGCLDEAGLFRERWLR
jgi:hypothetical protein